MKIPFFLEPSEAVYQVRTKSPGPQGALPFTDELLRYSPSGDVFALSLNAGMGWEPTQVHQNNFLILSTMGGFRAEDGTPIALGYHTGHWELGLLVKIAAETFKEMGCIPFAGYCSDPCDGRTQGTDGMMDSLAFRNSGAEVLGRLVRSLPTRKGVMGIATCDKGLPAMMMALAESSALPGILVPGGVTLPPEAGEDAGAIQSVGARFSHGEISLEEASALGCTACASPGGGCQFLGTAASSQVIGEALGLSLPHSALAPSGETVWLELAAQSARALRSLYERKISLRQVLTPGAVRNAMAVHAAIGASTNLLLHLPAIAHSAGLRRPTAEDWAAVNRAVPRIVDVLPNGPKNYVTVQVFLAGGVPEIMLHLRDRGLLDLSCMTVSGMTVGENLEWWESSERRRGFKKILLDCDGVDPGDVILSPDQAKTRCMTGTLVFPQGNIAPEGSVVKATAIDPSRCPEGVYSKRGKARVFSTEESAVEAVKSTGPNRLGEDDIIVLICRGPLGAGMPETAQITIALKYTKALRHVALITDGRFSGFSSGPCIGHVGPEALAGGPVGKILDGDILEIRIDRNTLEGSVNLVGEAGSLPEEWSIEFGSRILSQRRLRSDLQADPRLPGSVRLWAALQQAGGGTWGGCVYDVDSIVGKLSGNRPAQQTE